MAFAIAIEARELLDHFPEDARNRHESERENQCPHVGDRQQVDDGVGQSQPEEAHCPKRRHRIGLAGQMRHDHKGGKGGECLDGIDGPGFGCGMIASVQSAGGSSGARVIGACET